MPSPIIVWFRKDLRLADNPALFYASRENRPILALYIYDENEVGSAQRVWLHHSLSSLNQQLPLVLRKGEPLVILKELQEQTGASIYCNRCYEPNSRKVEEQLQDIQTFKGSLLMEPWEVAPKQAPFFRVFTPFWKQCLKILDPEAPLPVPKFKLFKEKIEGDSLDEWKLLPQHPNWAKDIEATWEMGEAAAHRRLDCFLKTGLKAYDPMRDVPSVDGTSRLSPHLHFGEISPRQLWHRCQGYPGAEAFLREIGWREFSYHLLYHFPDLASEPFNPRFQSFSWREQSGHFKAWTRGETGYPIVDAGMRQLWKTGWMHNRVRMIVASFLTKDLLIPWQKGALWFWDTLLDADLANNSAGWQWTAGCGADAAPYFRVFNPTLQSQKFDPEGTYIKEWVPELRHLDKKMIHHPWESKDIDYPPPLVDHKAAKEEALRRYAKIKN